jgi:hypothetical protein
MQYHFLKQQPDTNSSAVPFSVFPPSGFSELVSPCRYTPIYLDATRTLKNAFLLHRSNIITAGCLRQEIMQIDALIRTNAGTQRPSSIPVVITARTEYLDPFSIPAASPSVSAPVTTAASSLPPPSLNVISAPYTTYQAVTPRLNSPPSSLVLATSALTLTTSTVSNPVSTPVPTAPVAPSPRPTLSSQASVSSHSSGYNPPYSPLPSSNASPMLYSDALSISPTTSPAVRDSNPLEFDLDSAMDDHEFPELGS